MSVHAVDRGDLETTVVTFKFLVSTFYMISHNFLTLILKARVFTIKMVESLTVSAEAAEGMLSYWPLNLKPFSQKLKIRPDMLASSCSCKGILKSAFFFAFQRIFY